MKNNHEETVKEYPVKGFPLKFEWHTGVWVDIFNKQVELIRSDIIRARAEDKVIIYLSCPISARGGGYHGTNVEIAKFTERRILSQWGERFWILNPAQYQMESKEGAGLIMGHIKALGLPDNILDTLPKPSGGDYMRMWTRVLVEDVNVDAGKDALPAALYTGRNFDAFYFLAPSDMQAFFSAGGASTLTAGIEDYFSRRLCMDPDFLDYYSVPGIEWGPASSAAGPTSIENVKLKDQWEALRKDYFRFYAVRASINYSLGSHDEWNIFRLINNKRRALSMNNASPHTGIPGQLAGFFDGKQISPAAAETALSGGYALE